MNRLLPRTLFGRHLLLMGSLLLAGIVLAAFVFRVLVQGPNVRQYAAFSALQIEALGQALALLPPAERGARLAELRGDGLLRWEPARPPLEAFGEARPYVVREFVDTLRARLGERHAVFWHPAQNELWVELPRLDPPLWVVVSARGLARDVSLAAAAALALGAALALLGAVLISRRINRPLAALAAAARELGAGHAAAPLSEDAPREIAVVARQFNAMAAALARADEERALMLAGISHDLRTPLARLRLGVELLADNDADLIERLHRACHDIDAIVGQFTDFARLGGQGSPQGPLDLRELAEQVAAGFDELDPPLQLELPPAGMPAWGDGTAVQRALVNLIGNAVKHGGMPIQLVLRRDGDDAVLAVLDRGPGIDAGEIKRLKRPFTQGDASRQRGGTGLGLAIAERIAHSHRGRLELLRRTGGGLEARLVLPLRQV